MPSVGPSNIKVLALWQPWASLLVMSDKDTPPLKTIETRTYAPAARAPFWCAIHASKTFKLDGFAPSTLAMVSERFRRFGQMLSLPPLGAIVGVVQLVSYQRTDDLLRRNEVSAVERLFGDWITEGRYGWKCKFPHFFDEPIPHVGKQCLETTTPALAEKILIAMSESQAKWGVYGWTNALTDEPELKVA